VLFSTVADSTSITQERGVCSIETAGPNETPHGDQCSSTEETTLGKEGIERDDHDVRGELINQCGQQNGASTPSAKVDNSSNVDVPSISDDAGTPEQVQQLIQLVEKNDSIRSANTVEGEC
jgi:hypothetical protein